MSKSILVIDTPKNCIHCPLLTNTDECMVQDDDANFNAGDSWDDLMKGCPLRELPEEDHENHYPNKWIDGYSNGWNDCLKEIIGGDKND